MLSSLFLYGRDFLFISFFLFDFFTLNFTLPIALLLSTDDRETWFLFHSFFLGFICWVNTSSFLFLSFLFTLNGMHGSRNLFPFFWQCPQHLFSLSCSIWEWVFPSKLVKNVKEWRTSDRRRWRVVGEGIVVVVEVVVVVVVVRTLDGDGDQRLTGECWKFHLARFIWLDCVVRWPIGYLCGSRRASSIRYHRQWRLSMPKCSCQWRHIRPYQNEPLSPNPILHWSISPTRPPQLLLSFSLYSDDNELWNDDSCIGLVLKVSVVAKGRMVKASRDINWFLRPQQTDVKHPPYLSWTIFFCFFFSVSYFFIFFFPPTRISVHICERRKESKRERDNWSMLGAGTDAALKIHTQARGWREKEDECAGGRRKRE